MPSGAADPVCHHCPRSPNAVGRRIHDHGAQAGRLEQAGRMGGDVVGRYVVRHTPEVVAGQSSPAAGALAEEYEIGHEQSPSICRSLASRHTIGRPQANHHTTVRVVRSAVSADTIAAAEGRPAAAICAYFALVEGDRMTRRGRAHG